MYLTPFVVIVGILFYSYSMLKQRLDDNLEFKEKDFESLTLRQLQKKDQYSKQTKQFDSILDSLQNKLKDEYQEQLREFQEFVEEMENENITK